MALPVTQTHPSPRRGHWGTCGPSTQTRIQYKKTREATKSATLSAGGITELQEDNLIAQDKQRKNPIAIDCDRRVVGGGEEVAVAAPQAVGGGGEPQLLLLSDRRSEK